MNQYNQEGPRDLELIVCSTKEVVDPEDDTQSNYGTDSLCIRASSQDRVGRRKSPCRQGRTSS